jgi:hypothetical protein
MWVDSPDSPALAELHKPNLKSIFVLPSIIRNGTMEQLITKNILNVGNLSEQRLCWISYVDEYGPTIYYKEG